MYHQLRNLIHKYVDGTNQGEVWVDEEESKRLLRIGNFVLVDYVRAMVKLLAEHMADTNLELE